jgi:hypothetical protein
VQGAKDNPNQITRAQFRSHFSDKPNLEAVNKWNKDKNFIKAYLNSNGELVLEWDFVLQFSAPAQIKECLRLWEVVLPDVRNL